MKVIEQLILYNYVLLNQNIKLYIDDVELKHYGLFNKPFSMYSDINLILGSNTDLIVNLKVEFINRKNISSIFDLYIY